MMTHRARKALLIAAGVAISSLLETSPVKADETRFDATTSLYGFSSPNNSYGPWMIGDLRYVNAKGGGALNVELARRIDNDRLMPTQGTYAAVGYTTNLSDRLYGFAQVGIASSSPFARSTQHLEFDYKASPDKRLVFAIAEDFARYAGNTRLQQTSFGPTLYVHDGLLQVRAVVQANTGVQTRTGGLVSYDYIPSPRGKVSVSVLFGPQSYEMILPGMPQAFADLTGTTATVTGEHLISRGTGVRLSALYSRITNRTTGSRLYTERGLTLGYFVKH